MPYRELLKQAFQIVRRERALWILGIILALFGGGFSRGINFRGNFDSLGDGTSEVPFRFPGEMLDRIDPEALLPIALLIGCLAVALAGLAFVMQGVALAGLIQGADRAHAGLPLNWQELLRAGWSRKGYRLIGLRLLLFLPALIVLIIGLALFVVLIGLPLIGATGRPFEPEQTLPLLFLSGICLFMPAVMLLGILQWLLELIANYAARSIVIENRSILVALRSGWRLFRGNVLSSVVFSLLLGGIGVVIQLLIGIPLVLLFLLGGVLLLLVVNHLPLLLIALLAGGGILLLIMLGALLNGPLLAYFETGWTVVWRYLREIETAIEPVESAL